jgi:hypothetical protein
MRKLIVRTMAIAVMLTALVQARTVDAAPMTVVGGTTSVELAQPFLDLLEPGGPLSVGLIGSATLVGTTVNFPITGGFIDAATGDAELAHDGSGLTLAIGGIPVDLENFFITYNLLANTGQLAGDVAVSGAPAGNLPLFDINNFVLTLTAGASTTLEGVWGLPVGTLEGLTIGTANVGPEFAQAVPEPATAGLLARAFAALAFRRR